MAAKLGRAAIVMHGDEKGKAVLDRWKALLLNNDQDRGRIALEILWSGCRDVRVGEERPVHSINYLRSQKTRMGFALAPARTPHRERQRRGDLQEPG